MLIAFLYGCLVSYISERHPKYTEDFTFYTYNFANNYIYSLSVIKKDPQ